VISIRWFFALCGLTALLGACARQDGNGTPPVGSAMPAQAQPRLATMRLYVGPTEVEAEIAQRPREIMTGMMFRTNVLEDDAMLFVLGRPQRAGFWMKNCPTPLSCAYLSPEGVIEEIHFMTPFDTNPIVAASDNILFVLETKAGWFESNQVRTGMLVRTETGSLIETFYKAGLR